MTKISVFLLTLLLPLSSRAASQPNEARHLPPQAEIVRGVLVPVPREIFQNLDRFAHSNWRAVQRPELARWRPPGSSARNAILLGAVIAEGFIAVEARDTAETKEVGRALRKLARGLGIEKAALRRSRSIIDHAEGEDWSAVRKEWDGVLPDVQRGMDQIRSEPLAQLVSIGGWLRGMEALSALLGQEYSPEIARLLWQPAMFDYLEKQLTELNAEVRSDPVVLRMKEGILEVQKVLEPEDKEVSRQQAREASAFAAKLLTSIRR